MHNSGLGYGNSHLAVEAIKSVLLPPVVNFAGTDNFVNQGPVNGAIAATFVDESVHGKSITNWLPAYDV